MNEILIFLDNVNNYSSLVLMIATLIYVYFTYRLTKETTKLREVETTPFISMYAKPDFILTLVIENIGKAPAYDVKFEMDEKYKSLFQCGCDLKHNISYFSPNQQLTISMDTYPTLEKSEFTNIPIKVRYYSKDKKLFEDSFIIEWKYLSGSDINTNNLKEVKKAIEATTKEIKELNKIIQDKNYQVTTKLKIITLEKTDMYLKLVFSNGYLGKIRNDEINKLGIFDIEKVHLKDGDLMDYSNRTKLTAEEIYYIFQSINQKNNRQCKVKTVNFTKSIYS